MITTSGVQGISGTPFAVPFGTTGKLTSTPVASGSIGEAVTFNFNTTASSSPALGAPVDAYTFTLPAGSWFIVANLCVQASGGGGSGFGVTAGLLTDNSNTVLCAQQGGVISSSQPTVVSGFTMMTKVDISSSATYKLRMVVQNFSGLPTFTSVSSPGIVQPNTVVAVRVA